MELHIAPSNLIKFTFFWLNFNTKIRNNFIFDTFYTRPQPFIKFIKWTKIFILCSLKFDLKDKMIHFGSFWLRRQLVIYWWFLIIFLFFVKWVLRKSFLYECDIIIILIIFILKFNFQVPYNNNIIFTHNFFFFQGMSSLMYSL